MLRTRIITATVLALGFLTILFTVSHDIWCFLTLLATLIALWEWSNLIQLNRPQTVVLLSLGGLAGFVLSATNGYAYNLLAQEVLVGSALLFWLVVAPRWLLTRQPCQNRFMLSLLGLLLMLALWVAIIGLHLKGALILLAVLATVWLADSAAYFAGKRFGKRKLAPEISPGKTWEGVVGAFVGVAIYGAVLCQLFGYHLWLIALLFVMVALSVMGDLIESLLKRVAGVKDSSQLLPGHGGVLDRIDGILPALVFAMAWVMLSHYFPVMNSWIKISS